MGKRKDSSRLSVELSISHWTFSYIYRSVPVCRHCLRGRRSLLPREGSASGSPTSALLLGVQLPISGDEGKAKSVCPHSSLLQHCSRVRYFHRAQEWPKLSPPSLAAPRKPPYTEALLASRGRRTQQLGARGKVRAPGRFSSARKSGTVQRGGVAATQTSGAPFWVLFREAVALRKPQWLEEVALSPSG